MGRSTPGTNEPLRERPYVTQTHRRRKQARPKEILDAALALFVEKGFAAARVEEIAERAGMSKGTLYLYFASKEELLKTLIARRLSTEIAAVAQRAAAYGGTHADLLRQLLATWWSRIADDQIGGIIKLVISEVRNFPDLVDFWLNEIVEPSRRLIGEVVRKGMGCGEFRRVDPDVVVQSLVLPMIMVCVHRHTIGACITVDPLLDPPDFFQQHVDLVLHGLTSCKTAVASPSELHS